MSRTADLLAEVRACTLCVAELEPRPVFQFGSTARILVAGQAPGSKVHATGIPFDDPSGDRLRDWMGVDAETFYDPSKIALMPMGFCYPGKGRSGDNPPPPRCAVTWRRRLLARMPDIQFTLLVGRYAIDWHLPEQRKVSLSDTVRDWHQWAPSLVPMPHPSPRNILWIRRRPWFDGEVVPAVRDFVQSALAD